VFGRVTFANVIAAAACMIFMQAVAVDASDRYRSPRNPERKIRRSTSLIILHTTEAAARGSLRKLSERGECHFCVTEDGTIYRIIDRDKEAFHAGRSMWKGRDDVDKYSIGIECVGYHDKAMSVAQLKSIRALVKDLKAMYHLTDENVICHSHVAYGAPNKWQKRKHRGRKRCGMLFATPTVRKILDLKKKPKSDPDVKAGRLVVGDDYLNSVLYGNIDTMKSKYNFKSSDSKSKEKGKSVFSKFLDRKKEPEKKNPVIRSQAAKKKSNGKNSPAFKRIPTTIAELKARGYILRGYVSRKRTAAGIVGKKWNSPDTYYTIRNKVTPGNMIKESRIEAGMGIWTK
jgi:N-acetylmuramoyl-L-alanine amidase